MIKQIGTKIYYCKLSGNVIKIIGDMQGFVKETTLDEDYEIYDDLNERSKDQIECIKLEFGEYSKLSKDSTGVRVNLETKELEFSYDNFPVLPEEPSEIDVLHEKVNNLEEINNNMLNTQRKQDIMLFDNAFSIAELQMKLGV